MAGLVGGGGLGRLAYNYGFQRYDSTIMIVTIVIMVLMVQTGADHWRSHRPLGRPPLEPAPSVAPRITAPAIDPSPQTSGGLVRPARSQ